MSTTTLPPTFKALIVTTDRTVKVQELPMLQIAADEILVQVAAVAQNPTDWKHVAFVESAPGNPVGCDFAGHVVSTGSNVTSLAVGDAVAGFVHGAMYKDRGAFAQYLKTPAELAWKIPSGSVSLEEAATMGCGLWTAVQGLYHPTRLGLVEPPNKTPQNEWILVYGGSSSVGMFVIQLAHLSGYKVVTLASPKNHDLCKSFGADAVFDYKDPDVIAKIKDVTGNTIHNAFDTISTVESQTLSIQTFAPGPGKLLTIQGPQQDAQKLREDVKVQQTLLYTVHGQAFQYGSRAYYPASPEDRAHMANFLKKLPDLVSSGAIKPNPVKKWEGGLEAIVDGLQYMRDGKVSGEKIVYTL